MFLEDSNPLQAEEDEEEEDEEEDARIFNAWMQRCRGNELPKKTEDKERSTSTLAPPVDVRTNRRASLPCPVTAVTDRLGCSGKNIIRCFSTDAHWIHWIGEKKS